MADEKVELFLQNVHTLVEKRFRRTKNSSENYQSDTSENSIMENRLLCEYMRSGEIRYNRYKELMLNKYGYEMSIDNINELLRMRLGSFSSDRYIHKWVVETAKKFMDAVYDGTPKLFEQFKKQWNAGPRSRDGRRYRHLNRLCLLAIFSRARIMNKYDDLAMIECLTNGLATFLMRDICDLLSARCGAGINTSKTQTIALNLEQSMHRIEELERELERANIRIDDLEGDMDDHIRDAERTVLLDFFSKFNSEKYGSLLDQLLIMNGKIGKLQKTVNLPPELNGIFITIKNMVKFIRDNSLEPVAIPHSRHKVKLSDMDFWDYDGTPFANEEEEKEIEVISPGWKHIKLEMQISRPKVKEVMLNDN